MSKMNQGPAVDQSEHDEPFSPCQEGRATLVDTGRNKTNSGQRYGDTSSSPESGSINGDGNQSSKRRRRRKRSSNPGSSSEGKVDRTMSEVEPQLTQSSDSCAGFELQSECANVWFERSMYERAESLYQCWLANSSPVASHSSPRPINSPAPSNVPSMTSTCHHSNQVACHHVVQSVWVNKTTFDQAECYFVESMTQLSVPNSLNIPSPPDRPITSGTPDEGYQSLAPTPATPVLPQAEPVTLSRESINGLPHIPIELLRDVWLEKPQYDRAEATFYQNLCSNNSSKRSTCPSTSRSSDHPQSLVEEEEEDEEEVAVVKEEKRLVSQCKAEVFHALHPIQEEEEPIEVSDREETPAVSEICYFFHPDSERPWLEKWRYDAAEKHFYCNHRDEASDAVPPTPLSVKTMSGLDFLAQERIWFDKPRYDEAERRFYEQMNGTSGTPQSTGDVGANSILQDIARARENIQKSLAGLKNTLSNRVPSEPALNHLSQFQSASTSSNNTATDQSEIISRIKSLEQENQSLHKVVEDLRAALSKLEYRVGILEKSPAPVAPAPTPSVPYTNGTTVQQKNSTPEEEDGDDDQDDDFDLFGSDEDEEADQIKQQRLKEYAERKAKKPALIAKSSILLDVKPWDDETDMAKLEECVRSVQADGLLWGTSKLVPVGYGIKKLQIACVVEDDKVGTDLLEEEITKFEDYVQSVDVAAFNKI